MVLLRGVDILTQKPDFKLVGRDKELKLLSSILMRSKANSVLLIGPGGVGCSALCIGLQTCKKDPSTPFDIVAKRLFWLNVDKLFESGDSAKINEAFSKMMSELYRTTDSVLILEDTKDFIEAAKNNGCTHFINGLLLAVRNGRTQVIFEARDDDLDVVMKCHSDMREGFTLLDLEEPTGDNLLKILEVACDSLSKFHRIKISPDARLSAIELTNKYRTRDPGLSRAQPERSVTLIDRALSSYRLEAHEKPPGLDDLRAALSKAHDADKPGIEEQIQKLERDWLVTQEQIRESYQKLRLAEIEVIRLEDELEEQKEAERAKKLASNGGSHEDGETKSAIMNFKSAALKAGIESEEVKQIRQQMTANQKVIDENKAKFIQLTSCIDDALELTRDHILAEFSRISGIPASKLNQDEREKLKGLRKGLGDRIFGQDEALDRVANGIKVARLKSANTGEPNAWLFLGPSGVGKTELNKAVAYLLLDDEKALTRFDMSEYMEKHAVAKLIGAPPGYEGFEVGGILTNAMRKNPLRVLLFDEIEKAHPDVFNIFLQILSDGILTDNIGRTVGFGDSFIGMTTNIGQAHFLNPEYQDDKGDILPEKWKLAEAAAIDELLTVYRPEFLNRFNGRENIVCFRPLTQSSMQKIVQREIGKIDAEYRAQGIGVNPLRTDVLAQFCQDHYNPAIGARGLPGYLKAHFRPVIVNLLLEHPDLQGVFEVGYDHSTKLFVPEFKEA